MYKKYDEDVKKAVMTTKDLKLAKELGVPKTTAHYWINHQKSRENLGDNDLVALYSDKVRNLELELEYEKKKLTFLESVGEKVYELKKKGRRISYQTKKFIVNQVLEFLSIFSLTEMLRMIKLSESRYRRWLSETKICQITKKSDCQKRRPNELTGDEVLEILRLARSKRFGHYPLSSLYKKAVREGWVGCSIDSWRKYIALYGLGRNKKCEKKAYSPGVRASRPNEIWHMDITQFKTKSGEVVYLQAIIDNYSRYIVDWEVSDTKTAQESLDLLKRAKRKVKANAKEGLELFTDNGSENNWIGKFFFGSNIRRVIAKVDIDYSNSMIEAFFRSLKLNYCNEKIFRSPLDVKRAVKFYVREHNNIMPHNAFTFETPSEVYSGKWNHGKELDIKKRLEERRALRREKNKSFLACSSCEV